MDHQAFIFVSKTSAIIEALNALPKEQMFLKEVQRCLAITR
jgi:hypothetical protein